MFQEKISLTKALELEAIGEIVIIDLSPKSTTPVPHSHQESWRENYESLRRTHRTVNANKLFSFLSPEYFIEVNLGLAEGSENTFIWRYLHGIKSKTVKKLGQDNVEYVYILVNPNYPELVKIGMTIHDVERRVKGISGTGTVYEWVPKFSLPVRKGTAYKLEQSLHKVFAKFRVSSDQGSSREFFELSPLTAFDKLREVGEVFRVGDPIVY